MKNKMKITPAVRKALATIAGSLPPIPVMMPDGVTEQLIKTSKVISGADLLKQNSEYKVNGKKVDVKKQYVQKQFEVRAVNRHLNLADAYVNGGDESVGQYIKSVEKKSAENKEAKIKKQNKKPETL